MWQQVPPTLAKCDSSPKWANSCLECEEVSQCWSWKANRHGWPELTRGSRAGAVTHQRLLRLCLAGQSWPCCSFPGHLSCNTSDSWVMSSAVIINPYRCLFLRVQIPLLVNKSLNVRGSSIKLNVDSAVHVLRKCEADFHFNVSLFFHWNTISNWSVLPGFWTPCHTLSWTLRNPKLGCL